MKTTLVTGAAGFIGRHFWENAKKTRNLILVDRNPELDILVKEFNIENVVLDLGTQSLAALNTKVDEIVHFAAETHNDSSLRRPRDFIDSNILATFNLIQWALENDIRYHHVSTDEVYGDTDFDSLDKFSELSLYNPSSPYSATKAGSDMLVRAWVRSFGLRATISNTSNNYGKFQSVEKLIPRTAHLAMNGVKPKVYGSGRNVRDWIHVDDHVKGIMSILKHGEIGETYNLGADCTRSNLEIVQMILKHFGLDQDFIEFVEDRPGHDRRYAIDSTKARNELGWEPKKSVIEEHLLEILDYYAANPQSIEKVRNSGLSST